MHFLTRILELHSFESGILMVGNVFTVTIILSLQLLLLLSACINEKYVFMFTIITLIYLSEVSNKNNHLIPSLPDEITLQGMYPLVDRYTVRERVKFLFTNAETFISNMFHYFGHHTPIQNTPATVSNRANYELLCFFLCVFSFDTD